jgi:hypothetical protein
MNNFILAAIIVMAGVQFSARAQQAPPAATSPARNAPGTSGATPAVTELPRFDLDFPGGNPQQLVQAIQEKIGTLNVIVPAEHKDILIPPIKLRQVTVSHLFESITLASQKTVTFQTGSPSQNAFQERTLSYGFRTQGPVTPESIWYFHARQLPDFAEAKICRFYRLAPYLEKYSLDDITTAMQAGWKMLGEKELPELNYHQETKLLIAVGAPGKLELIDAALAALGGTDSGPKSTFERRLEEIQKKQ